MRRRWRATRTAARLIALLVAHALLVFLALQVSGVAPVLLGDCCTADGDDCSGPTDDKPCGDCPPGCPKCHCDQASFSVPPAVATNFLGVHPAMITVAWATPEAVGPRDASRSSVFRPPKRA